MSARQAKQTIFSVTNHHVEGCGQPPSSDSDERGAYVGYFATCTASRRCSTLCTPEPEAGGQR